MERPYCVIYGAFWICCRYFRMALEVDANCGAHWQYGGVITLASGRWSGRDQCRVVSEDRRALCFCMVSRNWGSVGSGLRKRSMERTT